MTAAELKVVRDAAAMIEVLHSMVVEAHRDGTCLGLDLRWVPAIGEVVDEEVLFALERLAYPTGRPHPDLEDTEWEVAHAKWVAPHERNQERLEKKFRTMLAQDEAAWAEVGERAGLAS